MQALLLRVDDLETNTSTHHSFARSPVRIGRNPLNDIVIDKPFISQWHGVVHFEESATQYVDLGSTNGTLANDHRLDKNVPVAVSGQVELRVVSIRLFCWRGEAPVASKSEPRPTLGPKSQTILDAEKHTNALGADAQAAASRFPEALAAVERLRPGYAAYRQSWTQLLAGIRAGIAPLPPSLQSVALMVLQKQMPTLVEESEFRALLEEKQLAAQGRAGMNAVSSELAGEFARSLTPGVSFTSAADLEVYLARTSTVLQTFGRAFVELRKGFEQFESEMAVRTVGEITPLLRWREGREVLAYLLEPGVDAKARLQELTGAYADMMIHQVALLHGLMEGVRSLLARLSPESLGREAEAKAAAGPLGALRRLWPFRAAARWRRFVTRHRELTEEDRQISSAVFGVEFARAYSAIVGEKIEDRSSKLLRSPESAS